MASPAGLPMREGVSASTRVLPVLRDLNFTPHSLLSFLEHAEQNPQGINWKHRIETGLICDAQGHSLPPDTPYLPGQRIYYWRDAGSEPRIPFEEQILYQDEHILVADKPHFLPVTPTGRYVKETLLVRLKQRTGLADLTPMHRIDRDTAGLVMFCVRVSERDTYAAMFRQRQVHKTYECMAPFSSALSFPLVRKSRLMESAHSFMQMVEAEGEPNSETQIELIAQHGALAHYLLQPVTGKRHQLRVHMLGLGLPIVGDGIYPRLSAQSPAETFNYSQPLQLLAKRLQFIDPWSGQHKVFESKLSLSSVNIQSA